MKIKNSYYSTSTQNITAQNLLNETAYFAVSFTITTFSKFQGKNYFTGLQEYQQQLFLRQFLRLKKILT